MGVIASADESARTAVEDAATDEVTEGEWEQERRTPARTRSAGPAAVNRGSAVGYVATDEVPLGESELRLPPRTTPHDGGGGRRLRGRGPVGRLRGMPSRTWPRPDGFRGWLLRTMLWAEGGREPPLQMTPRDGPGKLRSERAKSLWTIM